MPTLKLSLQIKRNVKERSEVDLDDLPLLFHYQEDEKNVCIHADYFNGDINGFSFPFNAVINHNFNNGNYDLDANGLSAKMFKSGEGVTLTFQDENRCRKLVFEICG